MASNERLDSVVSTSLEQLLDEEKRISDGVVLLKSTQPPEPSAGFASGFINLLKTIVGSGNISLIVGMLSLPIAISSFGIIPGVLLLTLAGVMSAFGLHLLSVAADKVGRKSSFFTISQITYPKAAILFDFAVFIKCFGVASSYLVVIRDLMPVIAVSLGAVKGEIWADPIFWLTVFAVLMSPLSFLKKVDKLKYTSFLGLLSVFYMVILSIILASRFKDFGKGAELFSQVSVKTLKSMGVFIFAFTCHQNLFPIKNEAKNNSTKKMDFLISLCIGISWIIYGVFGFLCYGVYGTESQKNIFINLPTDEIEFIVARFLFVFLMACSYPLQTHPCRISVEKLLPIPLRIREKYDFIIDKSITLAIILGSYAVAFFFNDLSILTSLVGSTAGIIICHILPFVYYYKITEKDGWYPTKIAAAAMAIFGVLAVPFFLITFFL